jgi:hypothetical protein
MSEPNVWDPVVGFSVVAREGYGKEFVAATFLSHEHPDAEARANRHADRLRPLLTDAQVTVEPVRGTVVQVTACGQLAVVGSTAGE